MQKIVKSNSEHGYSMRMIVKEMSIIMLSLLVFAVLLVACGGQTATQAPVTEAPVVEQPTKSPTTVPTVAPTATQAPTPTPELAGDPVRGGLLYNDWMKGLGVDVPTADQALWATQTTNTRTGKGYLAP